MKKYSSILTALIFVLGFGLSLTAQYDDLYYDGSESLLTTTSDDLVYANDDDYAKQVVEEDYGYDDEIDEYVDYYTNDYDIDGYQYTNRIQAYRLSVFTSNYYGVPYWGTGAGFDSYFLSRYANDPFFASYIRNQLIFGPSYTRLRSVYGYGAYADPFSPFYNPYRRPGLYVGVGFGGGRGLYSPYSGYGSFGRGFGGGGYYCPPYGGYASNRLARTAVGNSVTQRNVVNNNRRTSTTTTSTRNRNNIYGTSSSARTSTSTASRPSVRNATNTGSRSVSSRKATTSRSGIGTSSSRRSSATSTGTRSSSRSTYRGSTNSSSRTYRPSSSTPRSSNRSVGSSRTTSTRSSGVRSSAPRKSSPRTSTPRSNPKTSPRS